MQVGSLRTAGAPGVPGVPASVAPARDRACAPPVITTPIPRYHLGSDFAYMLSPEEPSFRPRRHARYRRQSSSKPPQLAPPLSKTSSRTAGPAEMADWPLDRQAPRSFPLVSTTRPPTRHDAAPTPSFAIPAADNDVIPSGSRSIRSNLSRHRPTDPVRPRTREGLTEPSGTDAPSEVVVVPAAVPRPNPPNIRLISAEAEEESQKVRSLYTSGEGLNWEDAGEPPPQPGDGADSQLASDVPSDAEHNDNDTYDFLVCQSLTTEPLR